MPGLGYVRWKTIGRCLSGSETQFLRKRSTIEVEADLASLYL